MARSLLPLVWYQDGDVIHLAKQLLGKRLVTRFDGKMTSGKIVETEAYQAPEDKASHAYNNRRTKRTEVIFGDGGNAYVYLCYGIHHMFNVVTGPKETPHAILIRAVEPIDGIDVMEIRRATKNRLALTSGPGKLCQALGIFTINSGLPLWKSEAAITIENHYDDQKESDILARPRVGIGYAQEWISKPWRFSIRDNPFVSK